MPSIHSTRRNWTRPKRKNRRTDRAGNSDKSTRNGTNGVCVSFSANRACLLPIYLLLCPLEGGPGKDCYANAKQRVVASAIPLPPRHRSCWVKSLPHTRTAVAHFNIAHSHCTLSRGTSPCSCRRTVGGRTPSPCTVQSTTKQRTRRKPLVLCASKDRRCYKCYGCCCRWCWCWCWYCRLILESILRVAINSRTTLRWSCVWAHPIEVQLSFLRRMSSKCFQVGPRAQCKATSDEGRQVDDGRQSYRRNSSLRSFVATVARGRETARRSEVHNRRSAGAVFEWGK